MSTEPTSTSAGQMASAEDNPDIQIGPIRIVRHSKWFVTLSVLVTAASTLVGTTYAIVKYIEIKPLEQKLADAQASQTTVEAERQSLSTQMDKLQRSYAAIVKSADRPVLIFPPHEANIIGAQQTFTWDYARPDVAGYVFELRNITNPSAPPIRENVVRPETKQIFYQLAAGGRNEYLWTILPGQLVGDQIVPQGTPSNPSTFTVYDSVLDRIRLSHRLLVATTPTSYDRFVASNGNGSYSGFEVELMQRLASQLGPELHSTTPLTVKTIEIPWSGVFAALLQDEADMAIRSITKTRAREQQYPTLEFSTGYLTNHQIFIAQAKGQQFPEALNGARVGVKQNSFNESAAQFLAPKYHFIVDPSYVAYGDLYQALRDGSISCALVDSVLASDFLRSGGVQLGPALDDQLRSYYESTLGEDHEEYSVVLHRQSPHDEFRDAVERVMASQEFRSFLGTLKAKYGLQ